jgi:TolB protein
MGREIQGDHETSFMTPRIPHLLSLLAFLSAPTFAQEKVTVVGVPPLSTPDDRKTSAGSTAAIAWQATQLIAADLGSTAELMPTKPDQKDFYSYPEVTAPNYSKWRSAGVKALVTGFVRAQPDGRLAFGCYAYDVIAGRALGRTGFVIAPEDWRRAAHKCSDLVYSKVTGAPGGMFDTRIAYVAQSGNGAGRVKRIAVMNNDGEQHHYLTAGDSLIVTPRLAPGGARVAFVSFAGAVPHVILADVATGEQRALLPGPATSFAPRFSADGRRIAFAMMLGANSDIYVADSGGGAVQRLTVGPGVDTSPSFSPDGSRIVFESDRSGAQQLYMMNADGTGQRRLSFGGARYASPDWSPDGEWIAFTRRGPDGLRVGVIKPDGSGERLLTSGPGDEGPSWAPSGTTLLFQRTDAAGRSTLHRVSLAGGEPRRVTTPQDASDPDWSGTLD